jgi:PIN domain nuclease of toxin-antitoxin system
MTAVLDASAVLAVYFDEPGADQVQAILPGARLSSVNYTEVIGKLLDRGDALNGALRKLAAMGFHIVAHDAPLARLAGELRPLTRQLGLSLADRACLALAERERLPVLTADRKWSMLDIGIDIRLIR